MKKIKEIPNRVREVIKDFDKNAVVILFGSRARGDNQRDSDWDFLIITQKEATLEFQDKIREKLYYIELETEQVISSIIENKQVWKKYINSEFYRNIQKDGILIKPSKAA